MNTPIIENLIPRLRETVATQIKNYLGGKGELSGIYESMEFWWDGVRDREFPDLPMWSDLPSPDRDRLFDAWIEAMEGFFASRGKPVGPANIAEDNVPLAQEAMWTCDTCSGVFMAGQAHFYTGGQPSHSGWSAANQSLPVSVAESKGPGSLFSRMEAALRASAKELDHFHRTGQPTKSLMASETLILGLGDLIAELNRMPMEAVSVAQDDGCAVCGKSGKPSPAGICQSCLNPYHPVISGDSVSVAPAASLPSPLSGGVEQVKASQEGSVCEVDPLGEVLTTGRGFQYVEFKDRDDSPCKLQQSSAFDDEYVDEPGKTAVRLATDMGSLHLSRSHVLGLIAHLTAWLNTGSFDLKGPPSSHPSSEDTELLDWLEEHCSVSSYFSLYTQTLHVKDSIRSAIRAARAKEAQASTTSQKGGQVA